MSNSKLTKGAGNKALLIFSIVALVGGVIGGLVSESPNAQLGGWIAAAFGGIMLAVNILGSSNKIP